MASHGLVALPVARITLSINDDVAAHLDTYAKAHGLNRSQAAEDIFQSFFATNGKLVGPVDANTVAIAQIQEYLIHFYEVLEDHSDQLTAPPWVKQ